MRAKHREDANRERAEEACPHLQDQAPNRLDLAIEANLHGFEASIDLVEARPRFDPVCPELGFHAIESLVDLPESLFDLLESLVHLLESLVHLLEAPVDFLETPVDLLEALIHVVEAHVDVTPEVVEPIVGPAFPHRLHVAT
jgi:hypothetical protein